MSYSIATAMVIGQGTHGLDLDVTNSVLRLSPRVRHGGVRNWTGSGDGDKTSEIRWTRGGPTGAQPPARHHVVSAWGGSNARPSQVASVERNDVTSNAHGKSLCEQPLQLLPRRSDLMQRTTTYADRRPFGRNVKLVFLKDSTQTGSVFVRNPESSAPDRRHNRSLSADDMSTSSGDDEMHSSGTPGTLSPAEVLTISRYSSRAMSSSYMCSSADTGRETDTGATNTRSDIDVADDDVSKFRSNTDVLRSSGSRYFTPSASDVYSSTADGMTTSSSSNGSGGVSSSVCNNRHGPEVSREGATEWRRGIQRRAAGGPRRPAGRVTLAPGDDGASDEKQDEDGGTGASANTSRTCSNELLNVISIDDDKLRYRHYSGNINHNNNKMTLMTTKQTGGTRQSIGRSKTELTTAISTTGNSRRPQQQGRSHGMTDGGGRQRLLRAVDSALGHHRNSQQQFNFPQQQQQLYQRSGFNGNVDGLVTTGGGVGSSNGGRRPSRRASSDQLQQSSMSTDYGSTSRGTGGPTFAEMNKTLRREVENVWTQERRRGLAVFLGAAGIAAGEAFTRRPSDQNVMTVANGSGKNQGVAAAIPPRPQQTCKEFHMDTCSVVSDCSIYCEANDDKP